MIAVGLSSLLSGVASYALVVIAARSLDAAAYDRFAVFWAFAVVLGLGLYFPVEQETSRRGVAASAAGTHPAALLRPAFAAVGLVSLVVVAVTVLLAPILLGAAAPVVIVGVIAAAIGYSVQFPLRGVLSAERATSRYAVVVAAEAALRILLAAAVALSAGSGDAVWFALVVGVAALVSAIPALGRLRRSVVPQSHGMREMLAGSGLLIAAAVSVQLLLNSPVLLGGASVTTVGSAGVASAGSVLAALSVARIPVFVYQAGQVLVIPVIAAAIARGDVRTGTRLTASLIGGAAVIAVLLALAAVPLGGPIVSLLFGHDLVPDSGTLALLGGAVGVFLVALCCSDSLMATGTSHPLVAASWGGGLVIGVVVAVLNWGTPAGTSLPLLLGSCAALVGLAMRLGVVHRRMHKGRMPERGFREASR